MRVASTRSGDVSHRLTAVKLVIFPLTHMPGEFHSVYSEKSRLFKEARFGNAQYVAEVGTCTYHNKQPSSCDGNNYTAKKKIPVNILKQINYLKTKVQSKKAVLFNNMAVIVVQIGVFPSGSFPLSGSTSFHQLLWVEDDFPVPSVMVTRLHAIYCEREDHWHTFRHFCHFYQPRSTQFSIIRFTQRTKLFHSMFFFFVVFVRIAKETVLLLTARLREW